MGGSLANKICLCTQRILTSREAQVDNTEDIEDMVWLLQDLHLHSELSIKLSSAKKITKLLQDVMFGQTSQDVDSNEEDGPIHISSVNFRERMYRELKGLKIDKKVYELWSGFFD